MKIRELLTKNGVMSKKIENVDFHMNLLMQDISVLNNLFPDFKKTKKEDILQFVLELFEKCDSDNDKYDAKLDEMITRYTLQTDKFYGSHKTHKWDNGDFFKDDGFGFGTSPLGDSYDRIIDEENDRDL